MAGFAGLGLLLLVLGRRRPGVRLLAGAVVTLVLLGFLPVGTLMLRPLEDRFAQAAPEGLRPDGIVVLGGAIDQVIGAARGQVTISDSATRITAGAALARRYPKARLVYTGGSNAIVSAIGGEAEDARRLWVALGIDPGRITIEDQSRNTDENARFVRDVLRPVPGQTWILVTSAYHMPRSVGLFRTAGFPVVPYPVDYRTTGTWRDALPNLQLSAGLARLDFVTREWIGLVAYRLSGRIDDVFPGP